MKELGEGVPDVSPSDWHRVLLLQSNRKCHIIHGASKKEGDMTMKKGVKILLSVLVILAVAVISFFVGYKVAYDRSENSLNQNETLPQTFYAEIKEINDSNILVEGLSVNDYNYRGEFSFQVQDETKLEWRGTQLSVSELEVGDLVAITFMGGITETYPAGIDDVVRIQLLDDEK